MIDPAIFICETTNFQNICKIYPPKVKDVVANDEFSIYLKLLTITRNQLETQKKEQKLDETAIVDPFEFILNCAYNNIQFRQIAEDAFYFFIHEKIVFLFEDKKILVGDPEIIVTTLKSIDDLRFFDENNFFDFQNAIRASAGVKEEKPPEPINPNEDPRIRRIKELARKRDEIKNKQGSKNGIQLSTCLIAICCMGIGITPLNIGEMSYAAIDPIMNMMQNKEKYDIDIRSLLAGADSKKIKPKYWIRNFDKE